jgi:hypothetical protein
VELWSRQEVGFVVFIVSSPRHLFFFGTPHSVVFL